MLGYVRLGRLETIPWDELADFGPRAIRRILFEGTPPPSPPLDPTQLVAGLGDPPLAWSRKGMP